MNRPTHRAARLALAAALTLLPPLAGAQAPALQPTPAPLATAATRATMLGAARAGERVVAVGDYGLVTLSDDGGRSFRPARSVPISATLNAVSFADARHGWAVGHWGAILATADGGETWTLQRVDTTEDRPLFSVHFLDARHGIAVGLWSLLLVTRDGGAHWEPVNLPPPPGGGKADRNLMKIFAAPSGALFIAAERGMVLRSTDRGENWEYLDTGYKGSFWSGAALKNGTLLVAGLRGSLYRSEDGGSHWAPVDSHTLSSITDLIEVGGRVLGVALDGVQLESRDQGASFSATQRDDRLSFTALADGPAGPVRFSRRGAVAGGEAGR